MAVQPVVVGGTYEWYLNATKNSAAAPSTFAVWDLTGATITLTFLPPNAGAKKQYTASIVVAAEGTAHYVNPIGTFDVAGAWQYSWKISQSGVVIESMKKIFSVQPSAAAAA